MVRYQLIQGEYVVEDAVQVKYISYGIAAYEGETERARIEDVSLEKKEVEELVKICNDEELDLVHLRAVVEDFLATRKCSA
ncbi:MAG: hypothetical protein IJB80_05375 [Clostridia bacterium]|nr:hypothetical protein [Clostridia bacterium]